jgi:hypothetical protein
VKESHKFSSKSESKESKKKKKSNQRKLILWDTSHYEALRWENEVNEFLKLIQKTSGMKIKWLKGSWTDQLLSNRKLLNQTKILIMTGLASKNKISEKELSTIKNFVNKGGNLFLSAPLFKGEDTNTLASIFGAEFIWEKIIDEKNYEGNHKDHVIISKFHPHPISESIHDYCFGDYGGFPLKTTKTVISIAQTSDTSNPPNSIVLAATQYGKGIIVFCSSSTTFKDKYLDSFENRKLANNIFNFLTKTKKVGKSSIKKIKEKIMPTKKQPKIVSVKPKTEPKSKQKINEKSTIKEPISKQPLKIEVPKSKELKKITPKRTPHFSQDIEQQIDKLDEQLIFGEMDEITYEIEKIKLKKDKKNLETLLNEKRIGLSKYLTIQKTIQTKSNSCSSCGEILFGLEKFCPNCGEKIK